MSVVSLLDSQSSNLGSNHSRGLANRDLDDKALRSLVRKPPCRTCKKEQAGIKLHDYSLWKPRSNSIQYSRVSSVMETKNLKSYLLKVLFSRAQIEPSMKMEP